MTAEFGSPTRSTYLLRMQDQFHRWIARFVCAFFVVIAGCGDGADEPRGGTDAPVDGGVSPGQDSDGDTILDRDEGSGDTDSDGELDRNDQDSDNDTLSDADEAGDSDPATAPVDSDGDGVPDFQDPDSDNDGLGDRDEVNTHNTDPRAADSDGDGVTDLVETVAGTDPTDAAVSPRTRGDFVFLVPFEEPPSPERDTLSFRTNIAFADVYFLFDKSASMRAETEAVRASVVEILSDLQCVDSGTSCARDDECAAGSICSPFSGTCVSDPRMTNCILSVWSGVGRYGSGYSNDVNLQPDPSATEAAFTWSLNGSRERLLQTLHEIASPGASGIETGITCPAAPAGRFGCPQFRDEAKKIVVVFTDEDSDGGSSATTGTALQEAGVTLIGINSGGGSAEDELRRVLTASASLDRDGNPLYFEGQGTGVVGPVVQAINEIVEGVPLAVTIEATDEPGDAGDAIQFIDRLEANTTNPGCTMLETTDSNGDGVQDTFPAVIPGTTVCYDVVPRRNTTVMPEPEPLLFEAKLTVLGDGTPLDERRVFFLVPPRVAVPAVF